MAVGIGNNGIWFDPVTRSGCYGPPSGPIGMVVPNPPDYSPCDDRVSLGDHHHQGHHHFRGRHHFCSHIQDGRRPPTGSGSYLDKLQANDARQKEASERLAQMGFTKTSVVGANQMQSTVLGNGPIRSMADLLLKKSDMPVGTSYWQRPDGQKVVVGPDGSVNPQ